MNAHLLQLRSALERSQEPQTLDLLELPEPDEGLSPWAAWLLVGLIRHQDRQRWLAETITARLNVDLEALAAAGAMAHPEVDQRGLVPGLTEWEYDFHGRGCRLTHRINGESLDVDFHDETADWFDDFFYIAYLESLRAPEFAEQRLMELHRSIETIRLSFYELVEAGLLVCHATSKVVRLHPDCFVLEECIDALDQRWSVPQERLSIAAALGDWLFVKQQWPDDSPMPAAISERAARCRDLRFVRLKHLYDHPEPRLSDRSSLRSEALEAMADLDHPELPTLLKRALEEEASWLISTALEIIVPRKETRWTEPIHRLFRRINPNGERPERGLWLTCAEYLARNGVHLDEVKEALEKAQQNELAEAALLAMEYAPEKALPLFRRGLRSDTPSVRETAAASLAIIDEPWSRSELIAVLQESDDQEATAECRSALLLTHDAEAHRIVEEWEMRNPHEPELGEFLSMREHTLQSRDAFLQYQMQLLHDRVLPLRGRQPPEPS